jgi:signal transduction histidine kinase
MLQRVTARECRSHPDRALDLDVGEAVVVGDEELLERAFENLVRNALEAAGAGGRVWITASREDGCLVVAVADDGPGMSAAALAQLRPFYTTKASGTGLGLPLAAKIARLHQGELKLGPRSPRGLTVTVRLPVEGPR